MNYRQAYAFKAPAPRPGQPSAALLNLRKSFPELCFEHEGSIYLNHAWRAAGTCARCGTPVPKP